MKNKKIIILFSLIPIIFLVIFIAMQKIQKHTQSTPPKSLNNFSTKTIFSNQWYSSIYKNFPSQQMFSFPLAYRVSENGLEFSLPKIHKTESTIFGSFIQDFSAGLNDQLQKPTITKIGNWSISLELKTKTGKNLTYTLAHGLPSTILRTNDHQIILKFPDGYTIYNNNTQQITEKNQTIQTDAFRIETHGNNYIIALPKKTNVQLTEKQITLNANQTFIAALDTPKNFNLFKQTAQTEITDTTVTWEINNKHLTTTYTLSTNNQKTNSTPLIALLPHQYDSLTPCHSPCVKPLGSYETIRGKLTLVQTNSFTTTLPLITPETTYTPLKSNHSDFISALKEDQKQILKDNQPLNGNYFLGAWYGKATNIIMLLDSAGLSKEKQQLVDYLKPRLAQSLQYFTYDKKQKSIIANKPEFGNEKLNDHHFHYGYYIRAAANLATIDPSFRETVEPKINELINDIASTDRSAKNFPFLRNFDVYEGHSWADGYAGFGDGNNQESSSESIGAWYSLYLWAKNTNNKSLQETALYLYNTEINSTRYYWFGQNKIYTSPYNHAIASIVWGGKLDFATWFSGKPNMIYGIQILPITPASFGYLGTLKDFTPYANDFYKNGGDITDEWGDLFVIFESFYDPKKSLAVKSQIKKLETNNPKSLFLYTLYRNNDQ